MNETRHLLMIIPFFPPMAGGGVYRPLSFVKYLGEHGWRTTVVAPQGDAFWIQDDHLTAQIPPECRVIRTHTWSGQSVLSRVRRGDAPQKRSSRRFSWIRRGGAALLLPDTYVGWFPFAARAAARVMRDDRPHAIYSTSPPETSHLVARRVRGRSGVPWLADFRDPWMNLHLFPPPTPLHSALHRAMEARVCREAHVVVTTRWQQEDIERRYPSTSVTRIPNGFDGREVSALSGEPPSEGPLTILHAGMLTQDRSVAPLIAGLQRLFLVTPAFRQAIRVSFIGAHEDANERQVKDAGLSDVIAFSGAVSHAETLRRERTSHVLLLIKHGGDGYRGLVPGKLYEYIGVRRPILALVPDGEARDVVLGSGRGEAAALDDPGAIADAIARMHRAFTTGALETLYDLSPLPEYDRSHQTAALARLLDTIVKKGIA